MSRDHFCCVVCILKVGNTSNRWHHVGTRIMQLQSGLDLLLNPPKKKQTKTSISSGRDTTVCVELYNPAVPSSLIRMVWEFLQQNNISNDIKIIIHIHIPFSPEGSC